MPKILIVEDDARCRSRCATASSSKGIASPWREDGRRGLRLRPRRSADLIMLDVMLPKMSGTRRVPHGSASEKQSADHHAHGPRAGDRQGRRPQDGRGRLRHEAVQLHGADRARRGGAAPDDRGLAMDLTRSGTSRSTSGCCGRRRGNTRSTSRRSSSRSSSSSSSDVSRSSPATRCSTQSRGMRSTSLTRTVDTHIAKLRKKLEEDSRRAALHRHDLRLGVQFLG